MFWARNVTGAIEKQAPGLQNPYLFSDQASNKLNSSLLWLEGQQKNLLKVIYNILQITLSFLYSFVIETTNIFIHSRGSLKNQTRFQTRMGKVYTCFQTETGRHIPIWPIWESTATPGGNRSRSYDLLKSICSRNKPQDDWFLRPWS